MLVQLEPLPVGSIILRNELPVDMIKRMDHLRAILLFNLSSHTEAQLSRYDLDAQKMIPASKTLEEQTKANCHALYIESIKNFEEMITRIEQEGKSEEIVKEEGETFLETIESILKQATDYFEPLLTNHYNTRVTINQIVKILFIETVGSTDEVMSMDDFSKFFENFKVLPSVSSLFEEEPETPYQESISKFDTNEKGGLTCDELTRAIFDVIIDPVIHPLQINSEELYYSFNSLHKTLKELITPPKKEKPLLKRIPKPKEKPIKEKTGDEGEEEEGREEEENEEEEDAGDIEYIWVEVEEGEEDEEEEEDAPAFELDEFMEQMGTFKDLLEPLKMGYEIDEKLLKGEEEEEQEGEEEGGQEEEEEDDS
ncbi:hypothetical protein BLNAU_12266 [Blattamonas nauphoetae]|uniref:EF-hand domain-containing protein n=1 Tax=Blattamonas nauphoetae TaxID=2049346 RepID=A0ABQ9XK43_9EUKA|nr:hypothetical protein BLNAU_12266 [Blattamonas nauphoetae]